MQVGGYSLGTTGFVSGAATGAIGGAVSSPLRQVGNTLAGWQDGVSYKEWGMEILGGGVFGGALGGIGASIKGQNFWWGNSTPIASSNAGSMVRVGNQGDPNFKVTLDNEVNLNGGKSPFKNFSDQRQFRHIKGNKLYNGGSYFDNINDAKAVADAIKGGNAKFLGNTPGKGKFPVYRVNGITGFNHNVGAGFLNQPTSTFIVKGTSRFSIVPYNPSFGN